MNNIVVCIKQVPDTADVKINPETNTLVREGVKSIINPFDMYAIEEAVRLMAKHQLGIALGEERERLIAAFLRTLTGEYRGEQLK